MAAIDNINPINQRIIEFKDSDELILKIENINNSKERCLIHGFVENMGLSSKSEFYEGTTNKYILVTKTSKLHIKAKSLFSDSDTTMTNYVASLTVDAIKLFSIYSQIPIQIFLPKYFEYYRDTLGLYYDFDLWFDKFVGVMKKMPVSEFKCCSNEIKTRVIEYIKSNKEYQIFSRSNNPQVVNSELQLAVHGKPSLYTEHNAGKWFVSIDVKSANYRVLKHNCPTLFSGHGDWQSFLAQFDAPDFLSSSKQFREIVFGDLGLKKLSKLPIMFINVIFKNVGNSKFNELLKPVCYSDDEIVYEILNIDTFQASEFKIFIDGIPELCPEAPEEKYFHVRPFRLIQLGKFPYFAKEHFDQSLVEDGLGYHTEFKNVPKKFILQCIKYYEVNPITELDKKFVDENGYIATYDEPLF